MSVAHRPVPTDRSVSRRAIVAGAVAIVAWAISGCGVSLQRASRDVAHRVAHVADSSLVVSTRNGGVTVTTDPALEEVEIRATITCAAPTLAEARTRLEQARVVVERDPAGRLVVRPVFPEPAHGGDVAELTIALPDVSGVNVATGNGTVSVSDTRGMLKVRTSNGRVEADGHAGPIDVATSNGRITVRGATDRVRARSSNGRITVGTHRGGAGPLDLRSSNASVTLTVGPGFVGTIDAETSNGSVDLRDPAGRVASSSREDGPDLRVRIGEGGQTSSVTTSNGSITIEVSDADPAAGV